jgi:hypothetical protein
VARNQSITYTDDALTSRSRYTDEQVEAAMTVLQKKLPPNMVASIRDLPGGHKRVLVKALPDPDRDWLIRSLE